MGVVIGGTVAAVIILTISVLTLILLVFCHVKGLINLPWLLPPPSEGKGRLVVGSPMYLCLQDIQY